MLEEIESIQVPNKAEGGPGKRAELSLDISRHHFITVAVIKRRRAGACRGQLNCILDEKTNPRQQQQMQHKDYEQELMLICTLMAKKSQTSPHV